jgi:hypothetical protein
MPWNAAVSPFKINSLSASEVEITRLDDTGPDGVIDGRDATTEEYKAEHRERLDWASTMRPGDMRAGRVETVIECRRTSKQKPRRQRYQGREGDLNLRCATSETPVLLAPAMMQN